MISSVDADWNTEGTVLVACRNKALRFTLDNGTVWGDCTIVETGVPESSYDFVAVCHNGLFTTEGRFLAIARNEASATPIHTYSFVSTDGQTFTYAGCIDGTGDTTGEGGAMHPAYDSFGWVSVSAYDRVFGLKSNRQEANNHWMMCTAYAGLFTTGDGVTWTRRTIPNFEPPAFDYFSPVFDIFYHEESFTWIACSNGYFGESTLGYYPDDTVLTGIAKSLDNGETWTPVVGNIYALSQETSPISEDINGDYWTWEWAFVGRQGNTWFAIDTYGAGIRSLDLETWEPFYELSRPQDNEGDSGFFNPDEQSDYYDYYQRAMRNPWDGFSVPARNGLYYHTKNGVDWEQFPLALGGAESFAWFLADNWQFNLQRKLIALSVTGQRQSLGTPAACGVPVPVTLYVLPGAMVGYQSPGGGNGANNAYINVHGSQSGTVQGAGFGLRHDPGATGPFSPGSFRVELIPAEEIGTADISSVAPTGIPGVDFGDIFPFTVTVDMSGRMTLPDGVWIPYLDALYGSHINNYEPYFFIPVFTETAFAIYMRLVSIEAVVIQTGVYGNPGVLYLALGPDPNP